MNFTDIKELEKHAMKSRYGWKRFFRLGVDSDIKQIAESTVRRIKLKIEDFDDYQSRLDFIRQFPITKDRKA